ncbi:MAG: YdcF family protein [Alteraurantiacibacter sp.]|nr:YdcF family protein [Alteraurantiacibacter sp.]
MIARTIAFLVILWAFGFAWFAVDLPQPADFTPTQAIVVPTGSGGRIERGLEILRAGAAQRMLVTGVDADVRPGEFMAEYNVDPDLMACCVTLGFTAQDTRGNAREAADWITRNGIVSVRLVTADWHMRRSAMELADRLPASVGVLRDAVPTRPGFFTLLREYNKLLAAWLLAIA